MYFSCALSGTTRYRSCSRPLNGFIFSGRSIRKVLRTRFGLAASELFARSFKSCLRCISSSLTKAALSSGEDVFRAGRWLEITFQYVIIAAKLYITVDIDETPMTRVAKESKGSRSRLRTLKTTFSALSRLEAKHGLRDEYQQPDLETKRCWVAYKKSDSRRKRRRSLKHRTMETTYPETTKVEPSMISAVRLTRGLSSPLSSARGAAK